MPAVLELVFPDLSQEQYERLKEKVDRVNDPRDGGISHVVWWEGNHCHAIDVWESQAAWEAFGAARLGPASAELEISMDATPIFHDPHELLIVKTLAAP